MKRHRPQPLCTLAAERRLARLACAVFLAAFLSSTLLVVLSVGVASAIASPVLQAENEDLSEMNAVPDSAQAEGRSVARGLTPFSTFAAIEKAWNAGCPDSIAALFPKEDISLAIEPNIPEEASFSRQQATYILKDALCYTVTETFEFLEFRYEKGGDTPPYADAEWSYRRELNGELVTEKVHVTLRKEEGQWLISEIKVLD